MTSPGQIFRYTKKKYKDQKKAAELAQHRIRTIKARREYNKWSKERQARLKKEAEERALKEAAERAAAEAAEKLRIQQQEELKKVLQRSGAAHPPGAYTLSRTSCVLLVR